MVMNIKFKNKDVVLTVYWLIIILLPLLYSYKGREIAAFWLLKDIRRVLD